MKRYPVQPLLDACGMSMSAFAREYGLNGTSYKQAREHGLSATQADRWAVKAGFVAYEIWPDLLDDQIEDTKVPCEECGEGFHQTRKGHRFCSSQCRTRVNKRRLWANSAEHREKRRVYLRQYRSDAARVIARQKRAWVEANRERVREQNRLKMREWRARQREDAA